MKSVLTGLVLFGFTQGFASPSEDLKIAHGGGNKCFIKAFFAADPSDDQKAKAKEVHEMINKTFEDNKSNMQEKGAAFEAVMEKHPIVMDDAVKAAHDLGEAVHPVQAAVFSGAINVINVLDEDQRATFDRVYKRCMDK